MEALAEANGFAPDQARAIHRAIQDLQPAPPPTNRSLTRARSPNTAARSARVFFRKSPGASDGHVWGSGIYTDDSPSPPPLSTPAS